MILVNIESLSVDELRGIAEQEGIGNIESLSREEIIELLREKYEEDDDREIAGSDPNLRYLSGITDYRAISDYVEGLPGVEALPDSYPETEIHLVMRNASWAYCFWSVAPLLSDQLANDGASLSLSVTISAGGRDELYDVPVHASDSEWNIGIPYGDGCCEVALMADRGGERSVLATSERVVLADPYWLFHKDEMKDSDSLYRIYLSMLSSKEGELVSTPTVHDIVQAFKEADADE